MTAKEYLMQLPELRRRYHRRAIELELLRADLAPLRGISYDQAGGMLMPSSAARSEAMVDRIVDREAELAEEMRQLNDERTKIIRQIEALDDGRYGHLLFLRYVQELNLREIAEQINYSYDWARQAHGRALLVFAKKYGLDRKRTQKYTDKKNKR